MLVMLALLWPVSVFGVLAPSLPLELGLVGAALFLISSVTSLSSLTYQYITPMRLRAQALAVMAMVAALFGTGLGPILAGVLSDHLTHARDPLPLALAIFGGVTTPIVILLLVIVARAHKVRRLDLAVTAETQPPLPQAALGEDLGALTGKLATG